MSRAPCHWKSVAQKASRTSTVALCRRMPRRLVSCWIILPARSGASAAATSSHSRTSSAICTSTSSNRASKRSLDFGQCIGRDWLAEARPQLSQPATQGSPRSQASKVRRSSSTSMPPVFARAQWLAYELPCRRSACTLTIAKGTTRGRGGSRTTYSLSVSRRTQIKYKLLHFNSAFSPVSIDPLDQGQHRRLLRRR
jgi:hypothetical protein